MKRAGILIEILSLLALMAAVVIFRSPYAPVVGGPVDIEVLWAIEDTRTESEMPLVTRLLNHGIPLAYDEQENLFYCSLGLENGEDWPELHLTAPENPNVTICFSDDYTYDWCNEAIAEGYTYELMAYTETEYAYFYIVFTGLPIVSLSYDGEMTTEDTPVSFEMGKYGDGSLMSSGRAHVRGDGSLAWGQKKGYKVEFTRRLDGTGKVDVSVPGFGVTDELLLLPMVFDETLMLDRLSWEMYSTITSVNEPFGARKANYAEVFVNDEYAGVYLLLLPFGIEEELRKAGSHALATDSLYRTTVPTMAKDRPSLIGSGKGAPGYELFYSSDIENPFGALQGYVDLWNEEDDEAFIEKAGKCVDIDSAVRYMLFTEACGLADNTTNNLYIWTHMKNGSLTYRFFPWDMDRSWGIDALQDYDGWFVIPIIDRIVNLDVGNAKSKLSNTWTEMKQSGFTYETVEAYVAQYTHELNDSGAFLRNTNRWGVNAASADGWKILAYSSIRFEMLDEAIAFINSTNDSISFLSLDVRNGDPMVTSMAVWTQE